MLVAGLDLWGSSGALPAVFRRRRFGWVHYFPAPALSAEEAADPTLAMYSVCWARSGASARAVSDVEWLVLQARAHMSYG